MKNETIIALAGNANVGKSVIFNHLTGLNQIIGNWPGKTVERAEGIFKFKGRTVRIIDLPGIYSLSAYSQEEIVSMDFIAFEKPDVVINVVDASNLERNLLLTVQLLELHVPMVLALNQIDFARSKGIEIDTGKLSGMLRMPVVKTVATRGKGLDILLSKALDVADSAGQCINMGTYDLGQERILKYQEEINNSINKIYNIMYETNMSIVKEYHPLWLSLKLIERDKYIEEKVKGKAGDDRAYMEIQTEIAALGEKFDQPLSTIVTSDRYRIASSISESCTKRNSNKVKFNDLIDNMAMDKLWGYLLMALIIFVSFYGIFKFGEYFSEMLSDFFVRFKPFLYNTGIANIYKDILWDGIVEGFISAVTIVLPYILPFYIFLAIIENSGYLARIAFLMDKVMHKVGLHGKAIIPILMGFGCNVPAILGTKILETDREISIASFMSTLVPCSARIVIILGTIGVFMGPRYALVVLAFDVLIIYIAAYVANKIVPGKTYDLIMELPDYRLPALKPTIKQTWFRIKDFLYVALPIIIIGGLVIEILKMLNIFKYITHVTDPVIVNWLGLPSIVGIVLIFGLLRKELTIILLITLSGATSIAQILTPRQMIVFGIITMLYIPCIATIAALKKTVGWTKTTLIVAIEIFGSIVIGGILNHFLQLIMI
jgi:ferrous iron transport protein B